MDSVLSSLLGDLRQVADRQSKVFGAIIALVTQVYDGDKQQHKCGMVKVRFPWLQNKEDKDQIQPWYRLAMPCAGPDRGFYSVPKIDDEVLCICEQGTLEHGYVIGTLWNGSDPIPKTTDVTGKFSADDTIANPKDSGAPKGGYDTSEDAGHDWTGKAKNEAWYWRSATGSLFMFDDREGAEKVVITDGSGKNRIVIHRSDKLIEIVSEGTVSIHGKEAVNIAGGTVSISSGGDTSIHSGSNTNITADADVNQKAVNTNITNSTNLNVQSGATNVLQAGATNNLISGAPILITGPALNIIISGPIISTAAGPYVQVASNISLITAGILTTVSGGPTNFNAGPAINAKAGTINLN